MKQKEIINDTAFNKLYPFPTNLPKWLAIMVIVLIATFFAWSLFTSIL